MNRTDRLQAILTHLQSKKVVTAQEIADRFGLSLRTIYRDIRALEESGIPIGAEAGIGYYINESYNMQPVALTKEEASALIVGAKLMSKNGDIATNRDFENALFKIKSVLHPLEKQNAETLSQHIEVLGNEKEKNLYISEIQRAITEKKIIKIKYTSLKDPVPVERMVECVGLCNYSGKWHLFAWCHLRKDYRDFRLDRIVELSITDFSCYKDDILTLSQFLDLQKPFDVTPNISFRIKKDVHQYLDNWKEYYGFVFEEEHEDSYVMHFSSNNYTSIAFMILNSGCMATDIRPQEVIDSIRFYAKKTYDWYCKEL
ncbi:MAG: YafY family transcriptional regulator [Bacteroidales bacterium]|nr:YafY family transcriptional regulator [Bacteroidales bacterium]